jgi:transposase, IS5 family
MHPKQPEAEPQDDLFRVRLENLVDLRHPLVRLVGLIDWGRFEAEFGALYTDGGRPGLPTRLMVGLHLLTPLPVAAIPGGNFLTSTRLRPR